MMPQTFQANSAPLESSGHPLMLDQTLDQRFDNADLDIPAVLRHVKFGIALNQAQTATKRSFPAIMIKDLLDRVWFEEGRTCKAEEICASINLDDKLIHRLLHTLTERGSFILDGLDYWPSERLLTKMKSMLDDARIDYEDQDNRLVFKVLEPVFSRLEYNAKQLHHFSDQLSGRYLCVEQVLWKQQLIHPRQSTTASELSKTSRVPKSTLTTMLDQARSLGIIIEVPDGSDARVTRWQFDMRNPLNIERYHALRRSFARPS